MNREFVFHIRAMTRLIYFVTEEEDRFLTQLATRMKDDQVKRTWVFNGALGLVPITQLLGDWKSGAHQVDKVQGIHDALIKIYQDNPLEDMNLYIITDPELWLRDPLVQRRVLNIVQQLHHNDAVVKVVVFVGNRVAIPAKLQRYIEVVHDKGLSEAERTKVLTDKCSKLDIPAPANAPSLFRGMTSYEIDSAIGQSIIATKTEGPKIDPKVIMDFKRQQLRKTDLLTYTDVSEVSFDDLGGADNFKSWVEKNKACWSTEGKKFGLKPPKGILLVGVWGCGKSLGAKALANAWQLPVVSLEMGKLRSSGVGETEANVYRAMSIIESVAPCVVWVDEAEKSLAGSHSSSHSDAGTTSRVLGIFSTWLQETEAPICLVMTANSLRTLPVEFVNRMTERFFFDLPSTDERVTILKIHLRKQGQDVNATDAKGEPRYQLAELAEAAKNMVGREIQQAVEAAMVESFNQKLPFLSHQVLLKELTSKPRIYKTMVDELKEVLDWVGYDEEAKEGIRAKLASRSRSEVFQKFKVVE